jgi:hypothetical protein
LNKLLSILVFLFVLITCFSQGSEKDAKKKVWKQEKDYLKYQKKKNYKGPEDWYGSEPSSLQDEDDYYGTGSPGSQGIQYNPQQIQKDREKQFSKKSGNGNGDLEADPEIKRPDPITFPDIDSPDIDAPDLPDVDVPEAPVSFWKVILFLIILAAVIFLLYWWLKNRQPANTTIRQNVENDWNPEVITKTELELRLEDALSRDDFREGVRIYFTFILKELISKGWIQWKKDKTNHHYLLEVNSKPNSDIFRECVRIYDLIWYGEYEIDRKAYDILQPTLLNYYHSLKPMNE